ncbi:MAG TPA: DUF1573 domain-containing protein [Bacteroidales bacterium]|nr:DUF1573 domain-containing protein [Bacteroidales bacterium]
MKKISLIFAFVMLSVFVAVAQTSTTKTTVPKVAGPEITFENLEHDYGTITQGGNGDCVFKFKNTGNEPLILSDVRKSCGCTTPSWSKEPILPGQSGEIKVGYNTNNVGTFSKTITVISNATNANVTLIIKGTVNAKAN